MRGEGVYCHFRVGAFAWGRLHVNVRGGQLGSLHCCGMSAAARQLRTPPDGLHPPLFTPAPPRPCCSGGGIAPPLMDRSFFRQLHSALAPGGVLAVNYFGGRGAGLKQAWCRLRLEFGSGESIWLACESCHVWAR